MDERHRVALEVVSTGMALGSELLADLPKGRRGDMEIAVEALEAFSRTVAVRERNVIKLVTGGAEIGRIVEENIKKKHADTRLAIKARGLYVELELNKKRLLKTTRSEELRKFGEGLGHKAFKAAVSAQYSGEGVRSMEGVFASALALEKYLKAELGERSEKVVEGMWYKIGRLWEDGIAHSTAFELLLMHGPSELKELLAEIEKRVKEIEKEAKARGKRIIDPYSRLPRELKRALVEAFLDRAPEVLRALREEDLWVLQEIDEGVHKVKKLSQYKEYVERLEKIVDLLKAVTKELAERAEGEKRYGLVEANGKLYPAYMGPVKLSVQVEHVEKGSRKYAIIEAKYCDRMARVELDVEKYWRSTLLHNLTAIMTDDVRKFHEGRVLHGTTSPVQASERLLMWAIFMPGEYVLKVKHVYATKEGLSPVIEISSHFGRGGLAKIERESPIHRLVLRLARELVGRENLREVKGAANKVLAASWLMISAILNTPEGKKPSDGLAVLAEKGMLPRAALNRLRPIFEELDALLGAISREDKVQLVGKSVDYDGYVMNGLLLVIAKNIKKMPVELGGVEIRMADLAEAAAKAFYEHGGWVGGTLYFGPARNVPELKAPAFKAMAALIAQEMRKGVDELRRKELVEYVELRRYEINGGEIKILAPKVKEERTPITRKNLKESWKEFKIGKYTHLRLVIGGEEYELFYSGVRFAIRGEGAQKLKRALEELGLDVKMTSDGRLHLGYERLEALLSAGVEAYAVRKAKMGEAQWRLEITYRGVTMALKMFYDGRNNRLGKLNRTGKIETTIYEEDTSEGETVKLDLDLLATIREDRDCGDCLEKRLAEALNIASKKGFKWGVVGKRVKYLYVCLPSDFRDVVRRFYLNTY